MNGENASSRATVDIQLELITLKFYDGNVDGGYGPKTSAAVAAWQQTRWLVADGIFGMTSAGIMFPPAGSIHGLDYSFARPAPKMLAARGVRLVGRYLWSAKYTDGRTNKGISRAEFDALKAAGIDVFFFYETSAEDHISGWDTGVRHAKAAQAFLDVLGIPDGVVHFSVDNDAPLSEIPKILEGMKGAASILGADRAVGVGMKRAAIYGKFDVVKAVLDAGHTYACQTYAWSGGKWDARATTQQWSNGQWGDSVDFTRAMHPDFGQSA